ncbi:MAG: spermidine synthase, partial [Ignavibacteriaceae bacterium]|nr:spermidine synthase [Ignavibacteriaceae bacterium]
MQKKSNILKYALFATGLSGIVAEYILSTLATYFLGDSIMQWTLILSFMLFSMGLGSSLSRFIKTNLIDKFIFIEFLLSVLAAFSTSLAYTFSVYTEVRGIIIYSLAILIGILIGLEIPLVTRINEQFEELRVNIANVLEKDYYGSLLGGLFFAFVGLPYLGLTYTPFILGMVNFLVAVMLYIRLKPLFSINKNIIMVSAAAVLIIISTGAVFAKEIILYGEQAKYADKIVYSEQSRYQKLVVTQWNDYYWFYINGNQQLSTFDEWLYHEPLVHPAAALCGEVKDVLILGGGDGCAAREIFEHYNPQSVTVVDLDPAVTRLAQTNEIFRKLNKDAMLDK